jgi:hypothetical protein
MNATWRLSAAVAIVAIVAVAACKLGGSGGSGSSGGAAAGSSSAASSGFDSCSVVTQADAAAALGRSVSAGVLGDATVEGGLACVFYGPSAPTPHNPNAPQADTVRVVVVKGSEASTWYNDYKSKSRGQPISGIGDQAFYDGYASLSFMKGASYVRIAVAPAGAPPSLKDEEKLAQAILPRL